LRLFCHPDPGSGKTDRGVVAVFGKQSAIGVVLFRYHLSPMYSTPPSSDRTHSTPVAKDGPEVSVVRSPAFTFRHGAGSVDAKVYDAERAEHLAMAMKLGFKP